MLRNFFRAVGGFIFWSYERGSWQYDLMVALILAFIFLTPRGFFRDRQATVPAPVVQAR